MNRHDDTGEIAGFGEGDKPPSPGEPVGRVNLPEEPDDPDEANGFIALNDNGHRGVLNASAGQTREKVMYGLLAGVMMVLAMVLILQGVFEQKMPV